MAHRRNAGTGRCRAAPRAGITPAVGPYRAAVTADGIPLASFAVEEVQAEYERFVDAGVTFTQPPTAMGPVTIAVFDDTCGNLIQLVST